MPFQSYIETKVIFQSSFDWETSFFGRFRVHALLRYYIEKNVKIMSQDDITSSASEDRFQSLCGRS